MRKAFTREKLRNKLFCYAVIALPLVHFLIFSVGMNFSMVIKSFQDANGLGQTSGAFCGFDNYKNVILTFLGKLPTSDMVSYKAIRNSMSILPLTLFINMPLSLLFAYVIYQKCFAAKFFQITLFIPCIISAVVLCLSFNLVMSYSGLIPKFFKFVGLGNLVPAGGFMGDSETAWTSILIFSVWTGISTNLIYFCSAMGRLPDSVLESARIDGASNTRQFFSIVIPLIWGTISTISLTGVSAIFGWYLPTLLLTGGLYDTSTIGYIVVINAKDMNHVGWTSAFGVLISIIGTTVTLGFKKLMNSFWEDTEY